MTTTDRAWWRDAVIYQVYVRSFADSDGDGIGDLVGLAQRLDHLTSLGVDGLWLNPCYPSPGADHGYDVADYIDIDARYGGLPAFDALLAEAHRRGLRVLMDLVPNHCSVEHEWFVAAREAQPGSPERERFIFRTGRDAGAAPPNNWRSVFGGPAWTRVDGTDQWYLHSFDPSQPDFNWRNPDVVEYFDKVLRFWFDRGVDGIRIDVAHMLVKRADLPDWTFPPDGDSDYNGYAQNQPEVHEVLRRWRALADSYGRDLTLVGEIWVPTVTDLAAYLRPDELPQAFYFDLLMCPWDAAAFRASVSRGLAEIAATGATITWTLANHDVHRAVTRFGLRAADPPSSADPVGNVARARGDVDIAGGLRRARAALMLLLALPGSVYLYQGEELGLPEVLDLPDDARQDPIWFRSGGAEHGRDGCRVPLPWQADGPSLGFGPGPQSWLPQPAWYAEYAASEQLRTPNSTLRLYADALTSRKALASELADHELRWLAVPGRPDVLAYRRGELVCVTVFGEEPFTPPSTWGQIVLASAPADGGRLAGESAAWLKPTGS
ncbi:alpha-amylase family glycosyl hydrolase [Dactylosporangium sp. NPDC048998]|uniref:glycoside hydrolase family 13 protein n=1 Tax=Dactylosporangium sp. NPDC048998 TaxID=3363976 RepID=UPI00370F804E